MLDSWDLGLHLMVAITSVTLTVMWTKLRKQSETIDQLSHRTESLFRQSAFMSLIMWKLMKKKVTGKVEEEAPVREMEMEMEEEHHDSNPEPGHGDPFGDPFGEEQGSPTSGLCEVDPFVEEGGAIEFDGEW